ncbi:MAG TPA: hypothetical protein DCM06_07880, partial [Comamonadaceae bacterium]|nr:hypothetical protein [Comamonadaceae bacterium]
GNLDKQGEYDLKAVGEQMLEQLVDESEGGYGSDEGYGSDDGADDGAESGTGLSAEEPAAEGEAPEEADDPMKAMEEALQRQER